MALEDSRHNGVLINVAFPIALVLTIAAFLVLTNWSIPFANGGSCDPWHYFGQFFLADQPHAAVITRDEARVPEFIVGYLLQHIMHGIAIQYVNFLIWFVSASLAVYHSAKRLFGFAPAVIATIFFATQPLLVGNFSLTYTEGATAYSVIAFAFSIAGAYASEGWKRTVLLLGAGFFWGAAFHAHLESLTMNFVVALYCLDWQRKSLRAYVEDAVAKWALLFVGALVATAVFGAVNALVFHRPFLFFVPQFEAVFTVLIVEYRKADWYLQAGRGALILVGLAIVGAQVVYFRNHPQSDRHRRAFLTAAVPFSILVAAQLVYTLFLNGLSLEYDYWFVWFLAPLSLIIASVASLAELGAILASATFPIYLAASLFADLGRGRSPWQMLPPLGVPLLAAVIYGIVLLAIIRARPALALFATMLCLAILNATIRPEKYGLYAWTGSDQRAVYQRVYSGMDFLSKFRFAKTPKFWVNGRGDMWETIAYPRSYSYCLVQYLLPDLIGPPSPEYNAEHFSAGDDLVMAVSDKAQFAFALRTLHEQNLEFREVAEHSISYGRLSYSLIVGKLY